MILDAALWGVVWLLALALLVIAAVLCAPVEIGAEISTTEQPRILIKVAILGGVCPAFSIRGDRREGRKDETKASTEERRRKKRTRSKIFALAPDMMRAAPRLFSKIATRVRFEAIDANISFGLLHPADTGAVYGALAPIMLLVNASPSIRLTLQPNFGEAEFRGRGRLKARFTPIALALPGLEFAWTAFVAPRLSRALQ